jgi:hypothetical protein
LFGELVGFSSDITKPRLVGVGEDHDHGMLYAIFTLIGWELYLFRRFICLGALFVSELYLFWTLICLGALFVELFWLGALFG